MSTQVLQRMLRRTVACALVATLTPAFAAPGAVVNARIHTLDPSRPLANAMSWDANGRIIEFGTADAPLALAILRVRVIFGMNATAPRSR